MKKQIIVENQCGFGNFICRSRNTGDCEFWETKDNWQCIYGDKDGINCFNEQAQIKLLLRAIKNVRE